VGAGGGGFPTHVKLNAKAETVIANGAECEPLLHKDAVIMEESAAELVRGMQLAMEAVGAKEGVIGVKGKKKHAVEAVQAASKGTNVRVQLLGDYYPAGDEYDLVYNVTGKLIPPGGIPIAVGVVVNNVETFVNIAAAHDGKPLTHKTLTIAGAVKSPATLRVPIGMTFRECIEYAGGLDTDDPVLVIGGLMMGTHDRRSRHARHENFHRRGDFAAHASHDRTQNQTGQDAGEDRQVRVRPMPLLHRILSALFARLRRRAASSHAHARVQRHRRRLFQPMGGDVLFVRTVHAVFVPGRIISQGSLRRREVHDARQADEMDRPDESQTARDDGWPPRADQIARQKIARPRLRFARAAGAPGNFLAPADSAAQAKRRNRRAFQK
jgi:hypothetical protein